VKSEKEELLEAVKSISIASGIELAIVSEAVMSFQDSHMTRNEFIAECLEQAKDHQLSFFHRGRVVRQEPF